MQYGQTRAAIRMLWRVSTKKGKRKRRLLVHNVESEDRAGLAALLSGH
jgi:hypothetical protein